MTILCSDKTGTMTLNKMVIQTETPIYKQGETQYTLLRYEELSTYNAYTSRPATPNTKSSTLIKVAFSLRFAAMAAKWKDPPRDALDTLVFGAADLKSLSNVQQVDNLPLSILIKTSQLV